MGRFARVAFLATLLLITILAHASTAMAQSQDDVLKELSKRTGLSRDELLKRYQQGNLPQAAEPEKTPPGLTTPPSEVPPVVLPSAPGSAQSGAKTAAQAQDVQTAASGLFGMDFFKLPAGVFTQGGFGPVPDDYIVGVGDQLVVEVWGDVEFREERVVDRDGTIILPKGGKIFCAGLTMASINKSVREQLSRSYSGISGAPDKITTFLNVTLGKLRAIRIFVVGDAAQPGAYEVSSVATVFTALYAAGGPSASGSMRDIRLVRGNQVVGHLDMYSYLLSGDRSGDVLLREYDTVFIPPRGKTVTLSGSVRRPVIFEMTPGENLNDLLRFGGGFLATAANEILHLERILPPGMRTAGQPDRVQMDVSLDPTTNQPLDPTLADLRDGDIVRAGSVSDRLENWVEIQGAVKRPGRYEYTESMDVGSLLELAGRTWPELLGQRATIDRVAKDGTFQSFNFPLADVLEGRTAKVPLQPMDVLHIYSKWDLQDRYSVAISGDVRQPGVFPYREGLTLRDLILKAGGLRESADSLRAEVFRLRIDAISEKDLKAPPEKTVDVIYIPLGSDFLVSETGFLLQPHDQVVLRRLPWWEGQRTISLAGDVAYPGAYSLQNHRETLSDLIARAGGLKPTAYLEAARMYRSRDSVGNVAIDLRCALKHPHSQCDLLLVENDQVIVPSMVNTVKTMGAVGYPTSIPYVKGKPLAYYVNRAGGYAENAAKWKTRVVYPNGYARPIKRYWWDPPVMPGSTVVVPYKPPEEKMKPLDALEKVMGIVASTATAIFIIDRATK